MAKKTKRKVSGVMTGTQTPEVMEVMNEVPASQASTANVRTFSRRVSSSPVEFSPDYTFIMKDLKRIGLMAGTFFTLLIILSFFLK
jgi:hypothetical protein